MICWQLLLLDDLLTLSCHTRVVHGMVAAWCHCMTTAAAVHAFAAVQATHDLASMSFGVKRILVTAGNVSSLKVASTCSCGTECQS
jgi:hypothetical protein